LFVRYRSSPYQAAKGDGSNTQYQVVGFVSVMVSQAEGSADNMNLSV
jgi:hypothetical protein